MTLGNRWELVAFDNDGTLFQSHLSAVPAIQRGFQAYARQKGLNLPVPSVESMLRLIGNTPEQFYPALLPEELKGEASILREFSLQAEIEAVLKEGALYPGTEAVLEYLKEKGCKRVIITNASLRYITAVATRCRYSLLLDEVFYRGYNGWKTKEELLRAAIEKYRVEKVVMVGDRREDVEVGKKTGAFTVGCLYGYGSPEELSDADACVDSITELPAVLGL